jgi:hypothetical protein
MESPKGDLLSAFMSLSSRPSPMESNYVSKSSFSSNVVINTTKRKKKVIHELQDYWKLKGLLLKVKRTPRLIVEVETSKAIIEFLESYSDIEEQNYWRQLSTPQKYAIARRFTIIEGHSQKQFISTSSKSQEIFIVLSGKVEVTKVKKQLDYYWLKCTLNIVSVQIFDHTGDTEHSEYGHGTIFGSTDRFHEVGDELFTNQTSSSSSSSYRIPNHWRSTASITMCTLLKLTLKDYLYEIAPSKPIVDDEDEEENIDVVNSTGIKLKAEDIMCRKFERQSEKSLSKNLHEFLVEHEILPKTSQSTSYQYMRHGNIGRSMILNREENVVYILVEGSMKMQLVKPNKAADSQKCLSDPNSSYYEISCRREGQLPLNIKVSNQI